MAFAALHPEAGRIDATLPDLGCGLTWATIHKARPRVALRCPDCGHGVHAKVSSRKLRYFAHDPGRPDDCAWLNESLEHHLLKLELATAIRDVGWHAELEVRAPDGRWRADVLASAHDARRRVAFEAQLSPITDDDITDRTDRYRAEGIDVCWVATGSRPPWMSIAPSIRIQEPDDERPWTVGDDVARFDYSTGAWCIVGVTLTQFIAWALHEKVILHPVRRRYRRIWLEVGRRYVRRQTIWTTPRSVDEEDRHDAMRQRQEARKRQREQEQREAEQRRHQEAEAQRQEQQRRRDIEQAAERARRERQRAEQQRQWEIEAEQARQRREAEERQRQEQARAAEQARLQQEQREQQAAYAWWGDMSGAQLQQLCTAVADPVWNKEGIRLQFDPEPSADNGYGIAIYRSRQLYGIVRPSPASLHRVPRTVPVFLRNAREAQLITDTGTIAPDRVLHFDFPDFEQLSLI